MTEPDTMRTDPQLNEQRGRIEVTVGIDQLETFLTATEPEVRTYAAETLAAAATDRPGDVCSAVPTLTDHLADVPPVSAGAAAALAAVAESHPAAIQDAVPALTDCLEGPTAVRTDATAALAAVADVDPEAIAPAIDDLAQCVTDADEDRVRTNAMDAIETVAAADPARVADVTDVVVGATADDCDAVREHATATLATVATARSDAPEAAVAAFVDRLADEVAIREHATRGLRAIASDEPTAVTSALEAVTDRLDDDGQQCRADAAATLASVAAVEPGAVAAHVDPLAASLADVPAVRRESVRALRCVADSDPRAGAPVVPALIDRLDDSLEAVRTDAAAAIAAVASEEPTAAVDAVGPLASRLGTDSEVVDRHATATVAAVAAVRPSAVEPAVTALPTVLDADDETVRLDATRTCAAVAATAPDSVRPIADAVAERLADPQESVRERALETLQAVALEATDDGSALQDVLEHLESDDEWQRGYAARQLADAVAGGPTGDHAAVRSLHRRLEDDSVAVRRAATRDLVTVADERPGEGIAATGPLAERLDDEDATVRNNAAIALERLARSHPEAVAEDGVLAALLGSVDDPDRTVRTTVRTVLATIAPDADGDCRPAFRVALEATGADGERVRGDACAALAVLGFERDAEVEAGIDAICDLLSTPTAADRAVALETLRSVCSSDVDASLEPLSVLVARLDDGNGGREQAVAAALADLVRIDPALVAPITGTLAERIPAATGTTRWTLLWTLPRLVAVTDHEAATALLLERLSTATDRRRVAADIARLALTAPGDVASQRDRLAALLEDDDRGVRGYATLALATLAAGGYDERDTLGGALDRVDDDLLDAASLAAGGETPTHTDAINAQLSAMGKRLGGDPWAAGLAVLALSVLSADAGRLRSFAVETIEPGLEAESALVRAVTARTLAELVEANPTGIGEVLPPLVDALEDPDAAVRAAAAATLETCAVLEGGPSVADCDRDHVGSLRARLADPDGRVRGRALRTLAAIDAPGTREDIESLEDDPVPSVQRAVSTAHDRLDRSPERVADRDAGDGAPSTGEWPMARGGPGRSGHVTDAAGPGHRPREQWRVDLAEAAIDAAPAVVDDTVVVGRDDGVFALSLATGTERWRFEIDGTVRAPPAVVDGTVYAATDGGLVALDPETGERTWAVRLGGTVRCPPIVTGDRIYVATDAVHAIDAETGDGEWTVDRGDEIAGMAVDDDGVYVAGAGDLSALDTSDGSRRWSTRLLGSATAPPAVADGTVYVATEETLIGVGTGEGKRRFRFGTGGLIERPPAVAGGTAYVASADGSVYAVDTSTQAERWRADLGTVTAGPIVVGDTVCLALEGGDVYGLAADDGSRRWQYDRTTPVTAIAAGGGRLCAVGDGIAAIGMEGPALSRSISGLLTRLGIADR